MVVLTMLLAALAFAAVAPANTEPRKQRRKTRQAAHQEFYKHCGGYMRDEVEALDSEAQKQATAKR